MDRCRTALAEHDRIGIDSAIFIYYLENHPRYGRLCEFIFRQAVEGWFRGLSSVVTFMEIAVKPIQIGDVDTAYEYVMVLRRLPNLQFAEVTEAVAMTAAELRAVYRVRPADALHIASAIEQGATAFLTNDARLRRVKELEVLMLDDFVDD